MRQIFVTALLWLCVFVVYVNAGISQTAIQPEDLSLIEVSLTQVPSTNNTAPAPAPAPTRCQNDCNNNGVCLEGICICNSGYLGGDCSQPFCVNDCSGHGECVNSVCRCEAGYFGEACDIAGCPYDCNKNGFCHQQQCVCFANYVGVYCEDERGCPNKCNGNGECKKNQCFCKPGFTGSSCQDLQCPNDCSGNGACDPKTGKCTCSNGFRGDDCGKRQCPNDCSGRGTCNEATGQCTCNEGYFGSDCAPENCPFNCSSRGTCILDAKTKTSYCKCAKGWSGIGCESEICPSMCGESVGKGKCTLQGCVCASEWSGTGCATRRCPDDCTSAKNGVCDESGGKFTCNCFAGWTGKNCAEKLCQDSCNYRGICKNGTCLCHDWWNGTACQIPICKSECSGRGICMKPPTNLAGLSDLERGIIGGANPSQQLEAAVQTLPKIPVERAYCECNDGWGGEDCSKKMCPKGCSGNGICNNGVCFCKKGYYGDDCTLVESVKANPAVQSELLESLTRCQDTCVHGKCLLVTKPALNSSSSNLKENATYECFCENQWAGRYCNESLVKCPASCLDERGVCRKDCKLKEACPAYRGVECGGRGTCVNGVCNCREPYYGDNCSVGGCPNDCNNKGLCNSKELKCLCFSGWTGEDCSKQLY